MDTFFLHMTQFGKYHHTTKVWYSNRSKGGNKTKKSNLAIKYCVFHDKQEAS